MALFAIVLLHEFGHSLATRQVGGTADTILLWPFGGVAYVNAPPRPGAELWSIAAGPLVNVLLFVPLTLGLGAASRMDLDLTHPDAFHLLNSIWTINFGLLIFNILPIYPLDGGQILRSLLWFVVGPVRSLLSASIVVSSASPPSSATRLRNDPSGWAQSPSTFRRLPGRLRARPRGSGTRQGLNRLATKLFDRHAFARLRGLSTSQPRCTAVW